MNCKAGMDFFPTNFMLHQPSPHDHQIQDPPSSAPPPPRHLTSWFPHQDFHGDASTTGVLGKRSPSSMLFSGFENYEHSTTGDEEMSSEEIDGCSGTHHHQEEEEEAMLLGDMMRKKRLNIDQVKTLEKSFELHGNKLEPDRKLQLAKAIGLQPRQVAIWFQNRRARWKTKQLEKDYDLLKQQFDTIKADNDALHAQNRLLNAQILALKGSRNNPSHEQINLNKETEGSGSNCRSSDNTSSDLKLNFSTITEQDHEQQQQHQIPPPTSRQFFPPSGLFPGIEDQPGGLIWPWLDHQHQHLNNN